MANSAKKLEARKVVGAKIRTRGWEAVKAGLRDRAFFSAGIDDTRFLGGAKDKLMLVLAEKKEQLANGNEAFVDRSSFIGDMREAARAAGLATNQEKVTDPASRARLGLIYDMQVQSARGHTRRQMDLDPDVLDAFPAQELIRLESRKAPRDWRARWVAAGGKLFGNRMIALKTDPVWEKISRFNVPWPPFDYGSGVGVRDVGRAEAEKLGLIEPDAPIEANDPDFNDALEATMTNLSDGYIATLKRIFGKQVEVENGKAKWRAA